MGGDLCPRSPNATRMQRRSLVRLPCGDCVRCSLFESPQLGEDGIIHRSNSVVFVEKDPADDALLVEDKHCRPGNLPVRIIEVVGVDDLVLDVGEYGKRKLEFIDKFAALVLTVDADRYDFCPLSGEFLVILGQTGQLLAAVRSPVAPIEHKDDFRLSKVVLQRNRRPRGRRQAELRGAIAHSRNGCKCYNREQARKHN